MRKPIVVILYEVFDFMTFTHVYYPGYRSAKAAYDKLQWGELAVVMIEKPTVKQQMCNLLNRVAMVLERTVLDVREKPTPEVPPFFEGECTCRPIPIATGVTMIGGEDDCPIHGFHEEE